MHIPIPLHSTSEVDTALLTILSTYLTLALTAIVRLHLNISSVKGKIKDNNFIHELANALEGSHHTWGSTLLSWIPSFTPLPSKHVDALLARAYTSLSNFSTTIVRPPETIHTTHRSAYRIRIYALQCLAHTTDGVVAPATVWEQALRFGSTYVKAMTCQRPGQSNNSEMEIEATRTVLSGCSQLVDCIESMPESGRKRLMKEKVFMSFLEWWMTFARRVS